MSVNYDLLPSGLRGGAQRYIEHGILPGEFLTAVLCNDLREAFAYADDANREQLYEIVRFFWNEAPSACWGSTEKMDKWLSSFQVEEVEQANESENPNP